MISRVRFDLHDWGSSDLRMMRWMNSVEGKKDGRVLN